MIIIIRGRVALRYLDLGDAVQVTHHLLKAQLDFLEQAQQRRQQSQ